MYRKDNGHHAAGQGNVIIQNVHEDMEVVNAVYMNVPLQGRTDTTYANFPPREHRVYNNPNTGETRIYSTIDDVQQGH